MKKEFPCYARILPGSEIFESVYDCNFNCVADAFYVDLPYQWSESSNLSIKDLEIKTRSHMLSMFNIYKYSLASILINSTFIAILGMEDLVIVNMKGQIEVVQPLKYSLKDYADFSDSLVCIGYSRTISHSPEIFTGYTKILYDSKNKRAYYGRDWHNIDFVPKRSPNRNDYIQLMNTVYSHVIIDGEGKHIYA